MKSRALFRRMLFSGVVGSAVSPAFAAETLTLPPVQVEAVQPENGYAAPVSRSATRTDTPLLDVPQSITVITQEAIKDLGAASMGDAVRYTPGVTLHQGENNRDQVVIRGNSTSADFFIDGARDDVQYYRDFYNIDRVEVLKGPNALAFGRGGSGGAINRVTKQPDGSRLRDFSISGGAFDDARIQGDVGDRLTDAITFRLNGVYENASSFRQFGDLERYGVTPSFGLRIDDDTRATVAYEHFHDHRFNDRGIPSQNGLPLAVAPGVFFGNPAVTYADAGVDSVAATIDHDFSPSLSFRNYTRYAAYGKFYQNVYAGSAVSAAGALNLVGYNNRSAVSAAGALNLVGYNNRLNRDNFTSQSDLTATLQTGEAVHKILLGAEVAHQGSVAFRNTAYFNNTSTTLTVSAANPISYAPVTFRQSATDADSNSGVNVLAGYFQDQVDLTAKLQLIAGLRVERFALDFHDHRAPAAFARTDTMVSPRAGLVYKPAEDFAVYTSYSTTFLPSAGDQFSTLTAQTQALAPEKLVNVEAGVKWDISPAVNATAAVYQLDRSNTRAADPSDPTRFVLTGASRTRGVELGITGQVMEHWQAIGGYAYQDAAITRTTSAARAGARVALVPSQTFSLWNKVDVTSRLAAGVGLIAQTHQYAAVDDTVRLPGFFRTDAAVYYTLADGVRLQVNVENLFDRHYILTADGNNNISPGSTRAVRAMLTTAF